MILKIVGKLSLVDRKRNMDFQLDIADPLIAKKSTDIWALGICILHLYLGRLQLLL